MHGNGQVRRRFIEVEKVKWGRNGDWEIDDDGDCDDETSLVNVVIVNGKQLFCLRCLNECVWVNGV